MSSDERDCPSGFPFVHATDRQGPVQLFEASKTEAMLFARRRKHWGAKEGGPGAPYTAVFFFSFLLLSLSFFLSSFPSSFFLFSIFFLSFLCQADNGFRRSGCPSMTLSGWGWELGLWEEWEKGCCP